MTNNFKTINTNDSNRVRIGILKLRYIWILSFEISTDQASLTPKGEQAEK